MKYAVLLTAFCYKDAFTRYSILFFKSYYSCRICARYIGERCESLQRAYDQLEELLDVCEDDRLTVGVLEFSDLARGLWIALSCQRFLPRQR